jgi:hypothetical protein
MISLAPGGSAAWLWITPVVPHATSLGLIRQARHLDPEHEGAATAGA